MTHPHRRVLPNEVGSATRRRWPLRALACVALVALVQAAYRHAGGAELFFDSLQLTQDESITDVRESLDQLLHSGPRVGAYLTNLTFAIDHHGNRSRGLPGFHADRFVRTNVWIHAATCCMLFLLLAGLCDRYPPFEQSATSAAFFGAVFFAIHPLNVASVAYVVQRRGMLAALFCLAALAAYLKLREARKISRRLIWGAALFTSCLLALKSKSQAVILPIALVALEYCLRAGNRAALRRFYKWLVPCLVLIAGGLAVFLYSLGLLNARAFEVRATGPLAAWGPWEQLLTQMRVLADFWRLILLPIPARLSLDHTYEISRSLSEGAVYGCIALHIGILAAALLIARRGWGVAAFGCLLFYISALPWIFLPQTEQLVEYKTYLGLASFAMILTACLARVRPRAGKLAASIALGLAAGLLLVLTDQRCRIFSDPVLLWSDVIAKSPTNFRARVNLGDALTRVNRTTEALAAYQGASRLEPHNAFLHYLIGNAHRQAGTWEEAIAEYRAAREIAAEDLYIYVNLADVLSRANRHDEAIVELQIGLRRANTAADPATRAKAHFNLANSLAARGRSREAADSYRQAIRLRPDHANAHYGLGLVLAAMGRIDEAIAEYETSLRLQPDHTGCRQALQAATQARAGSRQ